MSASCPLYPSGQTLPRAIISTRSSHDGTENGKTLTGESNKSRLKKAWPTTLRVIGQMKDVRHARYAEVVTS
jgi:hypothetical protein